MPLNLYNAFDYCFSQFLFWIEVYTLQCVNVSVHLTRHPLIEFSTKEFQNHTDITSVHLNNLNINGLISISFRRPFKLPQFLFHRLIFRVSFKRYPQKLAQTRSASLPPFLLGLLQKSENNLCIASLTYPI